jgi:hypothetical protein
MSGTGLVDAPAHVGIFTHTLGPEVGVLLGDVNADDKVDAFDAYSGRQAAFRRQMLV